MRIYHNYHSQAHRFANKEIIEMFLFQLIKELGFGLVSVFVPIYLYTQGVPLLTIMIAFTVRSALHGLFALLISRHALLKLGIKHTFVISMMLYAVSFFIIQHDVTAAIIWAWVALSGFTNALYASAHHAYLAQNVDAHSAGKEVAMLSIVATLASIVTPLVGALLISLFGFQHMLLAGSTLLVISVIPLFFSAETNVSKQVLLGGFNHLREFWKSRKKIFLATIGHGFNGSSDPLWDSLYMYKLLGGITLLGGLRSAISFVQICVSYMSGRRLDANKSAFSIGINGSIAARMLTFASFHPYVAMMSETADGIIRPLFTTAYDATFYKELKGEYAISRVVAHESVWHLAHVFAMSVITLGIYLWGWYAFLIVGIFMIVSRLIIRHQRIGAADGTLETLQEKN